MRCHGGGGVATVVGGDLQCLPSLLGDGDGAVRNERALLQPPQASRSGVHNAGRFPPIHQGAPEQTFRTEIPRESRRISDDAHLLLRQPVQLLC